MRFNGVAQSGQSPAAVFYVGEAMPSAVVPCVFRRPARIGFAFQPPLLNHQAFADGLFGAGQEAFVEPRGVRPRGGVEDAGDLPGVEAPLNIFDASLPTLGLIGPVTKTSRISRPSWLTVT